MWKVTLQNSFILSKLWKITVHSYILGGIAGYSSARKTGFCVFFLIFIIQYFLLVLPTILHNKILLLCKSPGVRCKLTLRGFTFEPYIWRYSETHHHLLSVTR